MAAAAPVFGGPEMGADDAKPTMFLPISIHRRYMFLERQYEC
jgi:hypothetical protein